MVLAGAVLAGCTSPGSSRTTTSTSLRRPTATVAAGGRPAVGGPYRRASAAEVRRFLALARTTNQGFVATYRWLVPGVVPKVFVLAQRPSRLGSGTGDFAYVASAGGESLLFVQRSGRRYECLRRNRSSAWSCEGPLPWFSIGVELEILHFDQQAAFVVDMPQPGAGAGIWSGRLHDWRVRCLQYPALRSTVTWCVTETGITVFTTGSVFALEVTKLSSVVPAGAFVLPGRAGRWRGFDDLG